MLINIKSAPQWGTFVLTLSDLKENNTYIKLLIVDTLFYITNSFIFFSWVSEGKKRLLKKLNELQRGKMIQRCKYMDISCSWTGRLNYHYDVNSSQTGHRFNATLIKISARPSVDVN